MTKEVVTTYVLFMVEYIMPIDAITINITSI